MLGGVSTRSQEPVWQQAALGSDTESQKADSAAEQCHVIEAESLLSLIDKALGWKGTGETNQRPLRYRQARLVQVWQECREAALAPENAEPRVGLR